MKLDLIKSAKDTLKDFEKDAAKGGKIPEADPLCGDSCICGYYHTAESNFRTRTYA